MKLIRMDAELLIIIVTGLLSTTVAIVAKVNGDKKEEKFMVSQDSLIARQNELLLAQKDLLTLSEENKRKADKIVELQNVLQQKTQGISMSLIEETGLLSTLLLMDKYIIPKIRVVFTFDSPINKLLDDQGKKFRPKDLEPSPSFHIFQIPTAEGIGNIFTNTIKNQSHSYLRITANLGAVGLFERGLDVVKPVITNFVYFENNKQHVAIEFGAGQTNLAQLYSQIQKNETSIILRKNYGASLSEESVDKTEKEFIAQKITVSIEVPVIEDKGIWFKVNLSPDEKIHPIIKSDSDFQGKFYYSEYKWEVTKQNKGFIYNKVID